MTEIPRPQPPKSVEEVNTLLYQLDGATLEWWGFSVSHGRCVWKVTGLPQGIGYVFMVATYYVNVPLAMHTVRLRVATVEETEDLRKLLPPAEGKRLREQDYRIVECQEGKFSVWSMGFIIVWGETEADPLLRAM